ncbi:MAG TPA: CHC2 zinc finger domain-containing protein [Kribbella sp.]
MARTRRVPGKLSTLSEYELRHLGRHLAASGNGRHLRLCRSPRRRIRPSHNTFHCFGCGAGGDARMFAAAVGHRP